MTDMTDAKKGIMPETTLYGVNDGDTTFYISLIKEHDSEGEIINRKIIYPDGAEGNFGAFLKSAEPFVMRTPNEDAIKIVIDPKTLDAYAVPNEGISLAEHLMSGLIKDDTGNFRKPKNYIEIAKYRGGTRLVPAFEHNKE